MLLRPHHLLCIPHFTGHGYDAAFTAHMTALTATLSAAPQTPVTLICDCDDLCKACPHSACGLCDSAEKVAAMDAAVLQCCGLKAGVSAAWCDFSRIAMQNILKTDAFHQICSCCQWYALCRETGVHYDNC